MKFGDHRISHAPTCEGQRRRVEACGSPFSGESSTNGKHKLQQSWWSVHTPELGSLENLAGKSFRQWVVLTVVVASERLCDNWSEAQSLDGLSELTARQNCNPNIPKLFYGSNTMLREKNSVFSLIYKGGNIYIYTLVLG